MEAPLDVGGASVPSGSWTGKPHTTVSTVRLRGLVGMCALFDKYDDKGAGGMSEPLPTRIRRIPG
jgi:hypothetical protein